MTWRSTQPAVWPQTLPPRSGYNRPWVFRHNAHGKLLLLARSARNQAHPENRSGPLDPGLCKGTWYLPGAALAASLDQLDSMIATMFQQIQDGTATLQDRYAARYLRDTLEHFLATLHKGKNRDPDVGTFNHPIPLVAIEEPGTLNALHNMRLGLPWDTNVVGENGQNPVQVQVAEDQPARQVPGVQDDDGELGDAGREESPREARRSATPASGANGRNGPNRQQEYVVIDSDSEDEEDPMVQQRENPVDAAARHDQGLLLASLESRLTANQERKAQLISLAERGEVAEGGFKEMKEMGDKEETEVRLGIFRLRRLRDQNPHP